LLIVNLF